MLGVALHLSSLKSSALYACPGYDTKNFLATHTKFTSVYGDPSRCYADHGSQLVAGSKALDWAQVAREGGEKKTEWIFTAMGCSWRNGAAEIMILSANRTLFHVLQKE